VNSMACCSMAEPAAGAYQLSSKPLQWLPPTTGSEHQRSLKRASAQCMGRSCHLHLTLLEQALDLTWSPVVGPHRLLPLRHPCH
jgi:hypothetical protein